MWQQTTITTTPTYDMRDFEDGVKYRTTSAGNIGNLSRGAQFFMNDSCDDHKWTPSVSNVYTLTTASSML